MGKETISMYTESLTRGQQESHGQNLQRLGKELMTMDELTTLDVRLAEQKYSFIKACIIASLLFGFWHIAASVRNVVDGVQSPMGAFMMGLMLVGTSTLAGIQYAKLYKMTGALWVPMAFRFVNNASANLLHIVTASGADELQTIRLTITGTLSFIIMLIAFLRHRMKQKQ